MKKWLQGRVISSVLISGLLAVSSFAGTSSPNVSDESLQEKWDSFLSKNGLEIGGTAGAEYTRASVSGTAVDSSGDDLEKIQTTWLDLDLGLRPSDLAGGHLVLRFLQDWQTYFGYRSKPLSVRWMSMDGTWKDHLSYSLGDFREEYTPLTLSTPVPEFVMEPEIFAADREALMREEFLEGNTRLLQGAKLNLLQQFMEGTLVRLDLMGGRLQRPERLDGADWAALQNLHAGFQGNAYAPSDMDRFFWGENFEALAMNGILLGGTHVEIMDDKSSYETREFEMMDSTGNPGDTSLSLNWRDDVVAYRTRVLAGRAGLDFAALLGMKNLKLEATGEIAYSKEDNALVMPDSNSLTVALTDSTDTTIQVWPSDPKNFEGYATRLEVLMGWTATDTSLDVQLQGKMLQNDLEFRNPLSQSPSFLPVRNMNWINDQSTQRLYSTYDAVYNGVYKYTPAHVPESYDYAPFIKNSWQNGIQSPEQLSSLPTDPVVQLWLPNGDATPNVTGFSTNLTGSWNQAVELQILFGQMQETEALVKDKAVTTVRMGGGLQLNIDRLAGFKKKLNVSGSFVRTSASRDALTSEKETPTSVTESLLPSVTADLINAGVFWNMTRRWSLLAGLQRTHLLSNENNMALDRTQQMIKAGVEYGMARWASLSLESGLLSSTSSLTVYTPLLDGSLSPVKVDDDFSQLFTSVTFRVDF